MNIQALFLVTVFCLGLVCGSCTYGPAENRMSVENVRAKPGSHIIAVAVKSTKFRPPTGINTFPNGGVDKVLDRKAIIYLCDVATPELNQLVKISPPKSFTSSWSVWVLGWREDVLYFKLTGHHGTSVEDLKTTAVLFFRVDGEGAVESLQEIPPDIVFQHNSGPLPTVRFVRVRHGYADVDVMTDFSRSWRTILKTDHLQKKLILN